MASDNIYFAAKKPEETASILLKRSRSFYQTLQANAYLEKLYKMWRAYHGLYNNDLGYGHNISFAGEQGELVTFPVNHFRNLAEHIHVMITANRPVMEARAINTDYKSLAQTYLANGILDYYMRERKLEDALIQAAELAIVLGAGFIKMEWNATAGDEYDYDEESGQFIYTGDVQFSTLTPFDVVVDGTKESWNNEWIMVRKFENRFNLMAKYPELADKIAAIPTKSQKSMQRLVIFSNDDTDDICVYEFFHKRTEALPDGRYMLFLENDIVLLDTKMPYRDIPIYRIAPKSILGTPYGYTPMFDIFPIQELINMAYSAIATNQNAFAVQNVFVPRGADISVNSLNGAMNIIEGNAKPEPLNLTETPAEVFKYLEILISTAETLSGVNPVARGNPPPSLQSGTALALVQSMALQFISGLQQSYVRMVEDVGTSLIHILKDFATTPKVIALVGKNNRPLLKEFTGEKISSINRVVVDIGNPLSKTIAGRVEMAQQMLQMNMFKTPQQYFQVLNTGRLDAAFEGEMDELLLIKRENEHLMEGQNVPIASYDAHKMHIVEHKSVLSDPELRRDVNLIKSVNDHIQAHLDALRNTDPDLLVILGEQPLPPAGITQQGPPQPGAPQEQNTQAQILNPQAGETVPGNQQQGPGVTNVENPNIPKVDASLLPNPQAQDQTLGNVK